MAIANIVRISSKNAEIIAKKMTEYQQEYPNFFVYFDCYENKIVITRDEHNIISNE